MSESIAARRRRLLSLTLLLQDEVDTRMVLCYAGQTELCGCVRRQERFLPAGTNVLAACKTLAQIQKKTQPAARKERRYVLARCAKSTKRSIAAASQLCSQRGMQ